MTTKEQIIKIANKFIGSRTIIYDDVYKYLHHSIHKDGAYRTTLFNNILLNVGYQYIGSYKAFKKVSVEVVTKMNGVELHPGDDFWIRSFPNN